MAQYALLTFGAFGSVVCVLPGYTVSPQVPKFGNGRRVRAMYSPSVWLTGKSLSSVRVSVAGGFSGFFHSMGKYLPSGTNVPFPRTRAKLKILYMDINAQQAIAFLIFLLSAGAAFYFIAWCFRDTPQTRGHL
jgi:hypothetical protein